MGHPTLISTLLSLSVIFLHFSSSSLAGSSVCRPFVPPFTHSFPATSEFALDRSSLLPIVLQRLTWSSPPYRLSNRTLVEQASWRIPTTDALNVPPLVFDLRPLFASWQFLAPSVSPHARLDLSCSSVVAFLFFPFFEALEVGHFSF